MVNVAFLTGRKPGAVAAWLNSLYIKKNNLIVSLNVKDRNFIQSLPKFSFANYELFSREICETRILGNVSSGVPGNTITYVELI